MKIYPDQLYHIYNRGNNKEPLFFNRENYLYFLRFVRKHILPQSEILAYCLMPNHFHFMIYANEKSAEKIKLGLLDICRLANGFRIALSSYAKGVNVQQNRENVLFKPKTEAKNILDGSANYAFTCFQYIHQNPYKAGLVSKIEDWEFSSFRDYAGLRNGTLCNQRIANQFIDFDKDNFIQQSYSLIDEGLIKYIFCD
jgi:putative transposase